MAGKENDDGSARNPILYQETESVKRKAQAVFQSEDGQLIVNPMALPSARLTQNMRQYEAQHPYKEPHAWSPRSKSPAKESDHIAAMTREMKEDRVIPGKAEDDLSPSMQRNLSIEQHGRRMFELERFNESFKYPLLHVFEELGEWQAKGVKKLRSPKLRTLEDTTNGMRSNLDLSIEVPSYTGRLAHASENEELKSTACHLPFLEKDQKARGQLPKSGSLDPTSVEVSTPPPAQQNLRSMHINGRSTDVAPIQDMLTRPRSRTLFDDLAIWRSMDTGMRPFLKTTALNSDSLAKCPSSKKVPKRVEASRSLMTE